MHDRSARARRLLLLASALVGCVSAPPAKPAAQPAPDAHEVPIPADLAPHVKEAQAIGVQLYFLDKVSAIGTDVLAEQVPDFKSRNLAGWVTLREGDDQGKPKDSYAVLFLTKDSAPRLAYRIHVPLQGKPTLDTLSPPQWADEGVVRLFRARQTAIAQLPSVRRPINPVVLPGALVGRPDAILVYLLSAELDAGEMVFGIHYRVLVSGDGQTVRQFLPLSKSELIVRPRDLPPGAKVEGTFVTQIVTDWPLETHVFVSLLHKRAPIFVGTRRGVWMVTGDQIVLTSITP